MQVSSLLILIINMLNFSFLGFFDHGQKYTAESRCGDQRNVKVLLRHNPSGGNYVKELGKGGKEYYSSNIVYTEVFPLARNKT